MYFAASVLKDVTNVPPKLCCQLSVLLGHYLFGDFDCRTVKKNFPDKKQWVLPLSCNPMFSTKSAVLHLIWYALCFKLYSRPNLSFAWHCSFTPELWKKSKNDDIQFLIIFAIVKNSSLKCIFWIPDWRANSEQSTFFWNKFNFEWFTIDF